MKLSRRILIGAMAVSPLAMAMPAMGRNVVGYTPAALQALVAGGEPYLLDFAATWCSTCKAQERVLDSLQAENSAYDAIPIVRVDWDENRSGALVAALAIPRRSTLVLMQGENELGRVIAQTGRGVISALLDKAS